MKVAFLNGCSQVIRQKIISIGSKQKHSAHYFCQITFGESPINLSIPIFDFFRNSRPLGLQIVTFTHYLITNRMAVPLRCQTGFVGSQ